jgi:hypothetical protein
MATGQNLSIWSSHSVCLPGNNDCRGWLVHLLPPGPLPEIRELKSKNTLFEPIDHLLRLTSAVFVIFTFYGRDDEAEV